MNLSALAVHALHDNPLAKLELARRLLAETRSVDEVKAIHNLAEAARVYVRQARLGLEAQNDAAEIKLRAERRLGELLAALPKQDGGSIDSAGAPNVTAPVESVLVFYRGTWYRSGPAAMPHQAWLDLCGPRGLWRFPGTTDPTSPAPFPEELPERCITLFSFPDDVVADPFAGRGTTAAVAARLGRIGWTSDHDPSCVAAARAWVARQQSPPI